MVRSDEERRAVKARGAEVIRKDGGKSASKGDGERKWCLEVQGEQKEASAGAGQSGARVVADKAPPASTSPHLQHHKAPNCRHPGRLWGVLFAVEPLRAK